MINSNGKLINPLSDYAFMKGLGEQGDEQNLQALLNAILTEAKQPTFNSLKIVPKHFKTSDLKGEKNCVLDVEAVANNGKVNVEVQIVNHKNLHKRLLFYWARLYIAKFIEGDNYKNLPDVAVFAILDYTIEDDDQGTDFLSHWAITNQSNGKLFDNSLHFYIIELPKFRRFLNKNLQGNILHQWLAFLDPQTQQTIIDNLITINDNLMQTNEKIKAAFMDPDEYDLYVRRQIAHWDYVNGIEDAKKEGEEKGVEKGRKEGKAEKDVEWIIQLHDIGLSIEKIAQAAKKSTEEILAVLGKYGQKHKEKVWA
jgi:predicted transposase/invertase (TIGR01784 family)